MNGKVISESYRITVRHGMNNKEIVHDNIKYSENMYYDAFLLAGQRKVPVWIERITQWECPTLEYKIEFPYAGLLSLGTVVHADGITTGSDITGTRCIEPKHFARDVALSRYDGNNGWDIPETIEIHGCF